MPSTTDNPLELTDSDKAMLSEHASDVAAAAKKSFSLRDKLRGMKAATAKIVLFTDPDAAAEFAQHNGMMQALAGIIETLEAGSEERASVQADYDEGETKLDRLRSAMLDSALAVHMRAVPQVVIEAAQRHARKAYARKDGSIPEESQEDFLRMQNHEILGSVIVRVVDAQGNDLEVDPATVGDDLLEFLPVPQYARLLQAFNVLVFNDALAQQATEDPGF